MSEVDAEHALLPVVRSVYQRRGRPIDPAPYHQGALALAIALGLIVRDLCTVRHTKSARTWITAATREQRRAATHKRSLPVSVEEEDDNG